MPAPGCKCLVLCDNYSRSKKEHNRVKTVGRLHDTVEWIPFSMFNRLCLVTSDGYCKMSKFWKSVADHDDDAGGLTFSSIKAAIKDKRERRRSGVKVVQK